MVETQTAVENEATYLLEGPRRLSQSMIWKIQRNFFEQKGTAAWGEHIVPHYITSNPFIAKAYAQVVSGFLRDIGAAGATKPGETRKSLEPGRPVYIVELGAGSGRFAFNFLSRFAEGRAGSVVQDVPVKYVVTDLAEKNLRFWENHPALAPFFASGILDLALFDAEHPHPLRLRHSGEVLGGGEVENPLILLANYFFDSIPQDAFYIQEGRLHASLLKLSTAQPEPDLNDPELLKRVNLIYTREPAEADYYDDPDWNRLLDYYRRRLSDTALDFPIAALQCLRFLREACGGRLLLLTGDKGYNRAQDLEGRKEPGYAVHGSFSMMVNYHALARYILDHGGQVLETSYRHSGLNILAFLSGQRPRDYGETRQAFYEAIEKQGPDDFFNMTQGIEAHLAAWSLEQILAYLRFSGWDSHIFCKCFPVLLEQVGAASEQMKGELAAAIRRLRDNYYYIGEEQDVLFNLGMLLDKMGQDAEAVEYFTRSLQLFGPAPSTYYNQAVCYYRLKQQDRAREAVNRALALNPAFEQAQKLADKIQSEGGGGRVPPGQ